MKVTLSQSIGYCDGIKFTLENINKIYKSNSKKRIHVFGHIAHNKKIIDSLNELHLDIVEDYTRFKRLVKKYDKDLDIVIFATNGIDCEIETYLKEQKIKYYDLTCPIIKNMLKEIKSTLKKKIPVAYLGKQNNQTTKAVLSLSTDIKFININNPKDELVSLKEGTYLFSQKSNSQYDISRIIANLKEKQPLIHLCHTPCQKTIDLEDSWYEVTSQEYLITLGSIKSSTVKEIFELSQSLYPDRQHLIFETLEEIKAFEFNNQKKIFLNAGPSYSLEQVEEIVTYLQSL
ncbi:MAG: hypothetical protein PUA56_05780 [Bacillales bacterium]|nr:hypothetical protein [Bacillales bacterium]